MTNVNASQIAASAASLMSASSVLIVVDAIDLAVAAAVVELARTTSAILVHVAPTDLAAIETQGLFTITPAEALKRADTLVIVGEVASSELTDENLRRLLASPRLKAQLHIDTGTAGAPIADTIKRIALPTRALIDVLGATKAKLTGKPVSADHPAAVLADQIVPTLTAATSTVFAYPSGRLDRYALYALMALADSVNSTARASLTPLFGHQGQSELTRMATSLTGLSPPVDFRSCRALHDHATLDAQTLVSDGDIDLAIWVSASNTPPPDWLTAAQRMIAIDATAPQVGVAHHLAIGIAGVDHPAIMEPSGLAACVMIGASASDAAQTSSKASAAEVITLLTSAIREARGDITPAPTPLGATI